MDWELRRLLPESTARTILIISDSMVFARTKRLSIKVLKGVQRRVWSMADQGLPSTIGLVKYRHKKRVPAGVVTYRTGENKEEAIELVRWSVSPAPTGPIYYTHFGMVVRRKQLLADYSVITPNMRETLYAMRDLRRYGSTAPRIKRGTILGMWHPLTYGDWFRQGLLMLSSEPIVQPVVLCQRYLYEQQYVRRDLERLGMEVYVAPISGVHIEDPVLLAPESSFVHWLPGEVDRIRNRLSINPPTAQPGSLLYLSREGQASTSIHRIYPSRSVEKLVHQFGGRVFRTSETSLDRYLALAAEAETVIADHGSALCNLAWWRTKHVVELQSTLKTPFFVTMASSAGVAEYHVIDTVGLSEERLRALISSALDRSPNLSN